MKAILIITANVRKLNLRLLDIENNFIGNLAQQFFWERCYYLSYQQRDSGQALLF
jgi:hypothetical protein